MPYNIPLRGSGGRNFILSLIQDQFFQSHLFGDPFPSFVGRICKKSFNLWPPPMGRVEQKLIKFPKVQIEFGLVAPSRRTIYPDSRHPTGECRKWCCSLNVRFHLCQSEILRTHHRFREGVHELISKLYKIMAKFLEVASPNHPLWQDVLCAHIQAYPFLRSELSVLLVEHFVSKRSREFN